MHWIVRTSIYLLLPMVTQHRKLFFSPPWDTVREGLTPEPKLFSHLSSHLSLSKESKINVAGRRTGHVCVCASACATSKNNAVASCPLQFLTTNRPRGRRFSLPSVRFCTFDSLIKRCWIIWGSINQWLSIVRWERNAISLFHPFFAV